MTFSDDIARHRDNVKRDFRRTFIAVTEEVQKSITEGSSITGAPGQPVQTGQLKGSWVPAFTDTWRWHTVTNLIYAPIIEDGVGITLRSPVGGFHSVKMTRSGFQRIVDEMTRRHGGGGTITTR